jgi:hypothetical protein
MSSWVMLIRIRHVMRNMERYTPVMLGFQQGIEIVEMIRG